MSSILLLAKSWKSCLGSPDIPVFRPEPGVAYAYLLTNPLLAQPISKPPFVGYSKRKITMHFNINILAPYRTFLIKLSACHLRVASNDKTLYQLSCVPALARSLAFINYCRRLRLLFWSEHKLTLLCQRTHPSASRAS